MTRETQQTGYPRTRPDIMPNHEPRVAARARYSPYLYSANRLKYPPMRKRLMKMWREAKTASRSGRGTGPIIEDADKAKASNRREVVAALFAPHGMNELIAASNVQ